MTSYVIGQELYDQFSTITSTGIPNITDYIEMAMEIVDLAIADRYLTPVETENLSGTISVTAGLKAVTGVGTSFIYELRKKRRKYLISVETGDLIKVASISSDTTLTLQYDAPNTLTSSDFYFIPGYINKTTKFWAAYLAIIKERLEQGSEKSVIAETERWKKLAEECTKKIQTGNFLDCELLLQKPAATSDRLICISDDNDIRDLVDENNLTFLSSDFC